MINTKPYIFFDFETGSTTPETTQPLELAAVAICPRKLELIPNSLFHSFIKPLSDEDAIKRGLDPVQKSALDVNKIKLEDLEDAPNEKTVWGSFTNWTYQWNIQKDSWNAPIAVHFNGQNFDMKIVSRLCKEYGPYNDKRKEQKIFNPIQQIDLKDICFLVNENNPEIEFNNMNAIREWLGMTTEGSHRADRDVIDGANIYCRFQRFIRHWASKTKFKM